MRSLVAVGAVLALCLAPSPVSAAAQPGEGDAAQFSRLFSIGRSSLQAEDYPAARGALEKAVALRPSDPEAHYYLGRAFAGDKKYKFAVEQFRETLRLAPGHVQALLDLASIEENTGRFTEAGDHYREALKPGPNARATRGLASLLTKQGKADEAIAMLRKVADAEGNDIESRYHLGVALMQKGDCAAAIPEFQAVIRKIPAHLSALFNLGNCLNRTGAADAGRQALDRFRATSQEEAAKVDRRRSAHFLMLEAVGKVESGDIEGVLAKLEEAIGIDPGNPRTHAIRAQILDMKGDSAGALRSYQKAADLDPADPVVLVEIGRLLGKTGRVADALPYLKRAAQISPTMPEPHLMLAAAYRQLGQAGEAAAEETVYRKLAAEQEASQPH